ncbi:hypothetical protein WICMUC_004021 [Wickerhamomyces mucosus]|uniref:Ribosomal lysine N-methyltransferase 5 n=1 Tax=Wickerhamomyces mucosus TaxID=1378264 RepID=A0A9P8TBM4_9ASCO|nr:hypothetical protein WICMUC_004021 [Wickerhamomyces mucosus]
MSTIFSYLEEISCEDIASHIYDLHISSESRGSNDLGILKKTSNLKITINSDTEYDFEQSISNLNNSSSSTGFVLWRISVPFLDWILNCKYYDFNKRYVVELGAGVSGLFAKFIGKRASHYIATDQYHLLKLLKKNISNNLSEFKSTTIDIEQTVLKKSKKQKKIHDLSTIDVCCYDWENIGQGIEELNQLNPQKPDFIIGCDIVYNDYLVPHLVDALDALSDENTIILIGLQLRLLDNIELFVETLIQKDFRIYSHTESILTDELKLGFVIYFIQKKRKS